MEAESRQAALLHPVADLLGIVGILRVDQAMADESMGEARGGVGNIAVVPGRPTGLHQNGPIDAVRVHLCQQFVGSSGFVRVGIPGWGGGADRVSGGIDFPDVNVGVYKHTVNLHELCGGRGAAARGLTNC